MDVIKAGLTGLSFLADVVALAPYFHQVQSWFTTALGLS
jgi:hypothetical protein